MDDSDLPRAGGPLALDERLGRVDDSISSLIDHTLLRPEATGDDIVRLCSEARLHGFACVCVYPCWVSLSVSELVGSSVKVGTVVGFPSGAATTEIKMAEAEAAVRIGARELDMVIRIGSLRSGDLVKVRQDINAVVEVAHAAGAIVKAIIETGFLTDEQKSTACRLAQEAGADFVKTSTGIGVSGATAHDVKLMRSVVGPAMGVKAAGGIRTLADLKSMVEAGATRIGTSAAVEIVAATF